MIADFGGEIDSIILKYQGACQVLVDMIFFGLDFVEESVRGYSAH